jgi:hypothetical protein
VAPHAPWSAHPNIRYPIIDNIVSRPLSVNGVRAAGTEQAAMEAEGEWEHARHCRDTPQWGKRHARRRQPVGPHGDGYARGTSTANRLLLNPQGCGGDRGPDPLILEAV